MSQFPRWKFKILLAVFILSGVFLWILTVKPVQAISHVPDDFLKTYNDTLGSENWNNLLGYSSTTHLVYSGANPLGNFVNTWLPAVILGPLGINAEPNSTQLTIKGTGGNVLDLLDSSGTNLFTVLNNGRVGIGTDVPNDTLSIGNAGVAPAGSAATGHNYTSTYLSADNYALVNYGLLKTVTDLFVPGGSNSLWSGTSTADIWNSNSGNVGIGTSTPAEKLTVTGNLFVDLPTSGAATFTEDPAGATSTGKIQLGRSADGWESISFDPTIGTHGKFVFTAPLQVAASSPGVTFYDPNDPTNTDKQRSIEYNATDLQLKIGDSFKTNFSTNTGMPPAFKVFFQIGPNDLSSAASQGIFIGANPPSNFTGDLLHFQVGGLTRFRVTKFGDIISGGATMTVSGPIINTTQTWDNSVVPFTAWLMNITDTNSSSTSKLLDLQVNNSSKFIIRKDGSVGIDTTNPNDLLSIGNSGSAPAGSAATGHNYTSTYLSTDNYALTNYGLVKTLIAGGSGSSVGYWTMNGTDIYNSNAGNVGIGTTGPGAKLDIISSAGTSALRIINSTGTNQIIKVNDSGAIELGNTTTGLNLAPNPNFGSNISSWDTVSGASSVAWRNEVSGDGSTGYHRFTIQSNGQWDRYRASGNIVSGGTSYTVSFWYRTSGITSGVAFFSTSDFNSMSNATTQSIPLNTNWTYYSFTFTTGIASYPVIGFYKNSDVGTGTFDMDNFSIIVYQANNVPVTISADRRLGIGVASPAGPLDIYTSGGGFLVTSAGNVGIGTTNPPSLLEVSGPQPTGTASSIPWGTRMLGQLNLQATDDYTSQKGGRITFSGSARYNSYVPTTYAAIQGKKYNANDGHYGGNLEFLTGKNDTGTLNVNMVIDTNGYVGIGTTNPNDLLSIGNSGSAPAGSSATGHNYTSTYLSTDNYALTNYGLVKTLIAGGSGSSVGYWTMNGTDIYNSNAGNVGIGTSSPTAKLHLITNNVVGGLGGIFVESQGAGTSDYASYTLKNNAGTIAQLFYSGSNYTLLPEIGANATGFYTNGAGGMTLMADNASANIKFVTGGSTVSQERMRITSGGNVGIGTTAPNLNAVGTALHINNNNASYAASLHFTNGTTGSAAANGTILGVWTDNNTYLWNYYASSSDMIFGNNNAEVMRLHGGKVGIGTTGPGANLHIYQGPAYSGVASLLLESGMSDGSGSNITLRDYAAGWESKITHYTTGGGATQQLRISVAGNQTMTLDRGNVGIGTTGPNDTFSIGNSGSAPAGSAATGHNYTSTYLSTDNYALTNYGLVKTLIAGGSGSSVGYWTMNGTDIYNSNAGNVGIGTTGPGAQLNVVSQSTVLGRGLMLDQYSTDAAAALNIFRKSRGTLASPTTVANGDYIGAFGIRAYDGSAFIDSAGFGARVNGTVTTGSVPQDIYFYTTGGANTTNPYTDNKVSMIIQSSGNVGIGTTAPDVQLQVAGNGTIMMGSGTVAAGSKLILASSDGGYSLSSPPTSTESNYIYRDNGSGSTVITGRIGSDTQADAYGINFLTGPGLRRMLISGTGNVGIGTTAPGSYKLNVAGDIFAGSNATNGIETVATFYGGNEASYWNSGTRIALGNLGTNIYSYHVNDAVSGAGTGIRFQTHLNSGNQTFDAVAISANGSLGVGDMLPAVKLSVVGNAAIGYASGQTAPANGLIISGNVGIGTSVPNDTLSIGNSGAAPAGSAATGHNYTSTYLSTDNYALTNYGLVKTLIAGGSGSSVGYWTMNGTDINNSNSGNVGIGTSSPLSTLEINGTFKAGTSSSSIILDANGNILIGI